MYSLKTPLLEKALTVARVGAMHKQQAAAFCFVVGTLESRLRPVADGSCTGETLHFECNQREHGQVSKGANVLRGLLHPCDLTKLGREKNAMYLVVSSVSAAVVSRFVSVSEECSVPSAMTGIP